MIVLSPTKFQARFLRFLFLLSLFACKKQPPNTTSSTAPDQVVDARFTLLSAEETGIDFSNEIIENFELNFYTYEYLYNGCGVAVGDINGDSLPDIYFGSTVGSNRLYLNLGNMQFEDITEAAGVGLADGFKTGVTMADVNGDGRLDIYVCRTSKQDDGKKSDVLFINMGNRIHNGISRPWFEDQTRQRGLADNSNTNHACFFDFDMDGDLDMFQLNHRIGFAEATQMRLRQELDGSISRITTPLTPFESNKLYRNDNGVFKDITEQAGLTNSAFGLSATVTDLNGDGWPDIYVANDYIEPDHIYINNQRGGFTDMFSSFVRVTSQNSMGADIGDINNDGLVDIVVLDMKAEDPFRYKELMHIMHYDRYNLLVTYGYGRQPGRNVLQLNNGNNTFSEIGQYAGIAATDWSWGALFADFDNDGWKDLYIANGYRKDITNLDYMNYFRDSIDRTGGLTQERFPDFQRFLDYIPEQKLPNYLYLNTGKLSFINATSAAGMAQPTFSNGAAYADLDLDGDLDLIVNNIEDRAFVYRNDITGRHWLQIKLTGSNGNTQAIGASAELYSGDVYQHALLMSNKGFLSSSEPVIHFGLGMSSKIDSVILTWPDGGKEIKYNVTPDQRIYWKKGDGATYKIKGKKDESPLFVSAPTKLTWTHQEEPFVDFKRERLLPYALSSEGPCLAVGDVNGDGLEDIFAGNGSGYTSAMLIQNSSGAFQSLLSEAFRIDSVYEDCAVLLEDVDGDGDLDLIVGSGGNAAAVNSPEYMTRLYLNDGKGVFTRSSSFPVIRTNAGAVLALDYDQDGDKDLLIAGKCTPGAFPKAPKSYLLRNDNGKFTDVTREVFPELEELGMISAVVSGDLNQDGKPEIIFAGDWMPVSVFSWNGKKFENQTSSYGLSQTAGWWKSLELVDIDGDGDLDLIAGNMGLNHRLRATIQEPVTLVTKDFDENGSLDPIMCFYHNGKMYPYAGRDALIGQIPALKKKFSRYAPYARATLQDIFSPEELKGSQYLFTHTFETTVWMNENGTFVARPLPYQVQLAPVYGIIVRDFNHDGLSDILMAGNFLYAETETGEINAGNGVLLLQQPDKSFRYVPNQHHGFWAQNEVRTLMPLRLASGEDAIVTGNNQGKIEIHIRTSVGSAIVQ